MNKTTIGAAVIAAFIAGTWTGFLATRAHHGLFGYEPCWSTLMDVYSEAEFQENMGRPNMWGWGHDTQTEEGCVLVEEGKKWKGWRQP